MEGETDADGWQYAQDFNAVNWAPKGTVLHRVRRRKFTRTRMRINEEKTVQTRSIRSLSDVPKPKLCAQRSLSPSEEKDFDGTLVVSYTNQFSLSWSTHGVIESSGYQCSIWKPKLGAHEFFWATCSAENTYHAASFLVIKQKEHNLRTTTRAATTTRSGGPSAAMHGHFYKPVAPKGYVSLGDVVIGKKKARR